MSVFPDWKKYLIPQRNLRTGCISWGYEIILHAAGIKNVNFDTFQDDFDLDKNLNLGQKSRNHFSTVADAVRQRYPQIEFKRKEFPKGQGFEKVCFIENFLVKQQPILISLTKAEFGGWHIMPVVDMDEYHFYLLNRFDSNGVENVIKMKKTEIAYRHDNWHGGEDVAFLLPTVDPT